jgi:ribosome-associated protein
VDVIADQQGEDILLLDIQDVSIITDYFVIASAASQRQAKAMVDQVREDVKEEFDVKPMGVDGEADSGWVLLDYNHIIVHIFTPEVRAYYDLEGLWQDARIVVRML